MKFSLRTSPNIYNMRTFKENKSGQDKFNERGRLGNFVGYPLTQKDYQIFDLRENKIIVLRDVTFVEAKFPYEKKK